MKFSIPTNRLRRFAFAAIISGIAIAVAHTAFTSAQTALPAFPGAAGFGANALGGRGGSVYVVTNLNDSGPGSFRDAVSQPNRYVVFAVGGVIRINSRIPVAPNLTIAGQTAPGDGITIYGNGLSFSNANNTVTRYLRIRMGVVGDSGADAMTIAQGDNMIFDHVSVSWGRDETFSVSGTASNITVQDSIIAQGLFSHSAGGLMETSGGVSIVRCLYIDNTTRNPKVKGVNEFVNNVVYNWGTGGGYILGDSAGQSFVNVIENYYINGPSTGIQPFTRGNLNFHIYAQNNYHDDNLNGQLDGAVVPQSGYTTISGDLFASGSPNVILNGSPNYGGTLDGSGATTPTNYTVTLNSNATLGHVVRRTDPVQLSIVVAPTSPTGTRSVTLNNASDPVGDWATVRNLTLNSNAGQVAAPAGAYGDFTANGGSGFTLGVAGSVLPSVYYFQRLGINNQARIEVAGPVIVVVANGVSVNGGVVGSADHPAWLTFNVYAGGLTLNGGANVYGYVAAPRGSVVINGNCQVVGGLASDRLTINNNGRLRLLAPSE